MSDKISRLNNLQQNAANVNESISDTITDLAGYCVLWLAVKELQNISEKSQQ